MMLLRRLPQPPPALGLLAFVVLVAALPLAFHTIPYALSTLSLVGINTIVTLGLCLLMGYAGNLSGQAAFYGLGAYGSAILTTRYAGRPGGPARGRGRSGWCLPDRSPSFAYGPLPGPWAPCLLRHRQHRLFPNGRASPRPHRPARIPHLSIGGVAIHTDLSYYYLCGSWP
jgi:hypothetical protein